MNAAVPPIWLERLLLLVLPDRDRETISGDLHEEYRERKLPQLGRARADFWYAWQVLSLVPRIRLRLAEQVVPWSRPSLRLLCIFTAMCGCWLGIMDLVLRHPGVLAREVIAATIVGQAVLTLAALHHGQSRLYAWAANAGTVSIVWLAVKAIRATLGGAHMEGYILLIATALIAQAVLTWIGVGTSAGRPRVSQ